MLEENHQKLFDYALRALSKRAHTVYELRQKLRRRKEYNSSAEESVIQRLLELNYLNDEDYLKRIIEKNHEFRFDSRHKFKQLALKKGLSLESFEQEWEVQTPNERELARKALQKRERRWEGLNSEERFKKQVNFLAYKGFSSQIIFDLVKKNENS